MINFSIILNSRNRPVLLQNLLNSILWTTSDVSKIEVLISADTDDIETQLFFNRYNPIWNGYLPSFASIEYIERDRNLHRRLNNLLNKTKGRYIFPLNDDCEITQASQDWDIKTFELLEGFNKDNIICGHVSCTSIDKEKGGEYSSFPIVSKRATDLLGHLISEELPGLGGDVYLWRIFSSINRIINLPLQVRHILHENIEQIIKCDKTTYEMREKTHSGANCWNMDINKEILKLQNEIYS